MVKGVVASERVIDQLTVTEFVNPGSLSGSQASTWTCWLGLMLAVAIFWDRRLAGTVGRKQMLFFGNGALAYFSHRDRHG